MKALNKPKHKKFMRCLNELSKPSATVLLIGLPLIAVVLLRLLAGFLNEIEFAPSYAATVYPPMFEYIMMSLALLIGGALLLDYIVKNNS